MSTAVSTLWVLLTKGMPRVQEPPEAADMGTCFGLEMALDDPIPPTPKKPERTEAAGHWWQRRTVRKPARA